MGPSADGTDRFVLGSIGPGTKLPSLGHTTFEAIRDAYFECVAGMLDGGADVRVVQELLGHASVTTTQIYTMVTVDQLREVYAQSHPRAR